MEKNKIKGLEKKLKALRTKSSKGKSGRREVDVLNELAHTLRSSDPKKADDYARRGLTLAQKLNYEKGIARSHYNICMSYSQRDDYDKALPHCLTSARICRRIAYERGLAATLTGIGQLYWKRGDFDKALEYDLRALKILEARGDRKTMAECCINIGAVYIDRGDYDKALEYLLRSLKTTEKIDDKGTIAVCCHNIGCVYDEQGNHDKALEYLLRSLKISEEMGAKNSIAHCHLNIGGVYYEKGKYNEALENYLKSLVIFEDADYKRGIAYACDEIGLVHIQLRRYDSALSFLNKALQIAQEISNKDGELKSYKYLSELYEKQQSFDNALRYYKKYTDLEKEMFNSERSKQIAEMETKYETEKKKRETEIYHLRNVKLRKEIRERKKAEAELKKHRDQLENLVADRTAQLRSLAHELSLVEEKQRRKIATYLHDVINQKLALAAFRLDAVNKARSVTRIRKEQKAIKKIIDQAVQLTRSLTFEISPPVLYEFGLEAALEWLVRQFSKQYRIPCDFKDDGKSKPLSDETRILLFQSVRELLANISKHARAGSVFVSTAKNDNFISIKVKDDGIGFDIRILDEKIAHNKGFGLFNLKERLRHSQGRLEVVSEKGQGTSVVIVAPLQQVRRRRSKERR